MMRAVGRHTVLSNTAHVQHSPTSPRSSKSTLYERTNDSGRPARIAALRAELAALEQEQRDEDDAAWLRAVALRVGRACFSPEDLRAHARVDRELETAIAGQSNKQIGKRLARLEGRTLAGLRVVRVVENERGWIWEIHFQHDAGVATGAGAD